MEDCIFCAIASGAIPARVAYEDDLVIAFHDISPAAPTHILLIPREHVQSAASLDEGHAAMLGRLFAVAAKLARDEGVQDGFRMVTNAGEMAGQSVGHLHFHLLAGRPMSWPPG